jgi:hypothetical protein
MKEIILKYLALKDHKTPVTIEKLIRHKISDSVVKIYHDAIAVEALELLEVYKTRLLLITDQEKHRPHAENESSLSVLSVYNVTLR